MTLPWSNLKAAVPVAARWGVNRQAAKNTKVLALFSWRPCRLGGLCFRVTRHAAVLLAVGAIGCGVDPTRPFERQSPEVKSAVVALDAGDAGAAAQMLESYLATGSCEEGGLGIPDTVRKRPQASFDLGIALFHLGERFGRRFGDEEKGGDAGPSPEEQMLTELRGTEVECALRVDLAIANEPDVPIDLRARAHYLAGNLEFLRRGYAEAVRHYDESLKLVPGMIDGGDTIGQDAAWNRAIALARIEEEKKKDAGQDAGEPETGPRDAGNDQKSSPDAHPDKPDGGPGNDRDKNDAGKPPPRDAGGQGPDAEAQKNEGQDGGEPPQQQPPPSVNQDERMLDMLESAPTFQQEDAKRAGARRVRGMADK